MSLAKYGKRVANKMPYICILNSTTQSIAHGGNAKVVQFDTIIADDENQVEGIGTSAPGIRIKRSGLYIVSASVCFDASAGVGTRNHSFRVNGDISNVLQISNRYDENVVVTLPISISARFEKNDLIESYAFQSSGAALNIDPTITGCKTFLSVIGLNLD